MIEQDAEDREYPVETEFRMNTPVKHLLSKCNSIQEESFYNQTASNKKLSMSSSLLIKPRGHVTERQNWNFNSTTNNAFNQAPETYSFNEGAQNH